ncbi:hypothetical protein [Actinomadura chokoriensis]|uniref:hypothetical protein n=1 Tax=Actinomadura chokoriensis TaxID=454156 RepID=UPI0031F9C630
MTGQATPDLDGLELYGKHGVWIVAEPDGGPVVAAFYTVTGSPGWWRGHSRGRVKQVFAPRDEPPAVAARFLRP